MKTIVRIHLIGCFLTDVLVVKRVTQNAKKSNKIFQFFLYSTAYNNKLLNHKRIIVLNFHEMFGSVGFTENYQRIVRIF